MSSADDNVALARAWLEAWGRGDADAVMDGLHPEVEIYSPPEVGNPGTYRGREGYRAWESRWIEAWESFENEILGAERVGHRHVVLEARQRGTGRGSGVEVNREVSMVCEIRDSRLVRFHIYSTHEQALTVARQGERG